VAKGVTSQSCLFRTEQPFPRPAADTWQTAHHPALHLAHLKTRRSLQTVWRGGGVGKGDQYSSVQLNLSHAFLV
jgi:hypothetical protein